MLKIDGYHHDIHFIHWFPYKSKGYMEITVSQDLEQKMFSLVAMEIKGLYGYSIVPRPRASNFSG